MGGWNSCYVAGWLLPFAFSFAIPVGVVRVAGGGGCFVCARGLSASALKSLQGSLPDIKCETDMNIFIVVCFL